MESSVRVGNKNKKIVEANIIQLPLIIALLFTKFCLLWSLDKKSFVWRVQRFFFIIIQNKGIFCVQQRFVRKYNKGHDLSEGFLYTILAACAMLLSVIFQTGFLQKWGNITKQHTFWGHTFLHNFTLLIFFHLENLTPYDY